MIDTCARNCPGTACRHRDCVSLAFPLRDGGCHQQSNKGTFTNVSITPKDTLTEQGVETQPGPSTAEMASKHFTHPPGNMSYDLNHSDEYAVLESQNCTSCSAHFKAITKRPVHICCLQETCTSDQSRGTVRKALAKRGWASAVSPCSPETAKPTAVVTTSIRHPGKLVEITGVTPEFREAYKSGRISICMVAINAQLACYIINCYGWTNGHTDTTAASRTDGLICCALHELDHHPCLPRFIVGDINAEVKDIASLHSLCSIGWTDLWGQRTDVGSFTQSANLPRTRKRTRPDTAGFYLCVPARLAVCCRI